VAASEDEAGLVEIVDALGRAGVPAAFRRSDRSLVVDGAPVDVKVRRMAVVTPVTARGLGRLPGDAVGIVIADRISADARAVLAEQGWGWVDRRGHVRVWQPGLRVSTESRPLSAVSANSRFDSVFPPVGIESALALLKEPEREWTVKDLAVAVGRSAGGVSERLRSLREAGLVDRHNRPICPDLFWELVGPWHVRPVGLGTFPDLAGPFDQLSWLGLPSGWVLTDTRAALLLGAPMLGSETAPPDFYVPQPSIADLAISHFGRARGEPSATVRPIHFAGIHQMEPFRQTSGGFRLAHPVVVALDLAHDQARGREMVESWDPTSLGVQRVW
jgi:hypothetical protein